MDNKIIEAGFSLLEFLIIVLIIGIISVFVYNSTFTKYDKNVGKILGKKNNTTVYYDQVCIDGVEYLERDIPYKGFFAPHIKPDGTAYTCK